MKGIDAAGERMSVEEGTGDKALIRNCSNALISKLRTKSEKECSDVIRAKWKDMSLDQKKQYQNDEESNKENSSRGYYEMLAYRQELLQWLVDLIRSPLPAPAKHWYVASFPWCFGIPRQDRRVQMADQ
jgi:hypothetical protein